MDVAAANGDLKRLKFLHEHNLKCTAVAMNSAAMNGHFEVVKWLHTNTSAGCTIDALNCAKEFGHTDIVNYLETHVLYGQLKKEREKELEEQNKIETDTRFIQAIHEGNTEVVKELCQKGVYISSASNIAVKNNQIEILKILHEASCICFVSSDTIDWAAAQGKFEILKILHGYGYEFSKSVMDFAASTGHLDIVKWLHKNNFKCTTDAMDLSACNGHLEVVKWLHSNRKEGCTIWAMNYAAENGHLDVVKWLHSERIEGCTKNALSGAAKNSHLDVIKFLYDNTSTSFSIEEAAQYGHLDVIKFLYENYKSKFNINRALHEGRKHSHIVKFLQMMKKKEKLLYNGELNSRTETESCICAEQMIQGREDIIQCASCMKCIHLECYCKWDKDNCVYCRNLLFKK